MGIRRQKVRGGGGYRRAIDSMNMSTPLLRYSYRPAINIWTNEVIRGVIRTQQEKTHVKSLLEVEVVMSVEVPTDEFIDLRLCSSVEVLELVHRLKFDDVQTIRKNTVGLALQ